MGQQIAEEQMPPCCTAAHGCQRTAEKFALQRAAVTTLFAILVPLAAHAATLRVPDISIALGANGAVLEVSIDNAMGLEEADLTIAYDPAALSVTSSALSTALTADCIVVSNYATPGIVYVSLACSQPLRGGGSLIALPVRPQKPGTSIVEIWRCELNDLTIPCGVGRGSVTVQGELQPANIAVGEFRSMLRAVSVPRHSLRERL